MSAIDDLIGQVQEPRLREQLKREWAEAQKTKKFGLMFDRHLPELVPIPNRVGVTAGLGSHMSRAQIYQLMNDVQWETLVPWSEPAAMR